MKCPDCQNEMIQSTAGWICLNCGHLADNPGKKASKAVMLRDHEATTHPGPPLPLSPLEIHESKQTWFKTVFGALLCALAALSFTGAAYALLKLSLGVK